MTGIPHHVVPADTAEELVRNLGAAPDIAAEDPVRNLGAALDIAAEYPADSKLEAGPVAASGRVEVQPGTAAAQAAASGPDCSCTAAPGEDNTSHWVADSAGYKLGVEHPGMSPWGSCFVHPLCPDCSGLADCLHCNKD